MESETMGWHQHHCIVLTSSEEDIELARDKALELFESNLVSDILNSKSNGYYTLVITPDGSKEGWEKSNDNDLKRTEFVAWLKREMKQTDFVEVQFGGDYNNCTILNKKE